MPILIDNGTALLYNEEKSPKYGQKECYKMKLKKLLSAAAASAMLLSAVPMNSIAADGEAEVLLSNDFEESFGTWKARTSGFSI